MELGEHDEALRVLAKARENGVNVKRHKNEQLYIPIRSTKAFKALMG